MKTIYNIEAQIEAKKILLKNNHIRLKELVKQNELLADVLEDYNKYNEILLKEEDLHKNAFELLNRHIISLLEDKTLSKNNIQNLKKEKREIEKMLKNK